MYFRSRHVWGVIGIWVVLTASVSADGVKMLDGQTLEGKLTALDAKTLTFKQKDGKTKSLAVADISDIQLNRTARASRFNRCRVSSIYGDVIPCRGVSLADGKAQLNHLMLGKLELKLGDIREILFYRSDETPEKILQECRQQKITSGDSDVLVVRKKDKALQSISGAIQKIDDKEIIFRFREKDRTVTADNVVAIFPARLPDSKSPAKPAGFIQLTRGTVVAFKSVTLEEEKFSFASLAFGALATEKENVASIRYYSDRVVELDTIKPAAVKEYGFFETTYPYRKNRCVSGRPMILGGRTYDRGLGLHSYCELKYALDKKYSLFVATVGIDDGVRPSGQATLTISGDSKSLFSKELTGKDKPILLRLNVKNVKTLTIVVDFGKDKLDAGDHVNLADARLIK